MSSIPDQIFPFQTADTMPYLQLKYKNLIRTFFYVPAVICLLPKVLMSLELPTSTP